jgi:glycosyltransferase involved in cell wall biosynthesis
LHLHILGTRGIPAAHGGFETFAEQLALYTVSQGHDVTVYCQTTADEQDRSDVWCGVKRVILSEPDGPKGTVRFDLRSAFRASQDVHATLLTLGYNTAIFSLIYRFRHKQSFMNMDGIEWRRQKWSPLQRIWLRANEWCGANLSDRLIADHPVIGQHLSQLVAPTKITVIPYGADAITDAPTAPLRRFGVEPGRYYIVIARPEPENSMLEIVQAYTARSRQFPLIMLGNYKPETSEYHAKVLAAGKGGNVLFPGAIYDGETITSLRFHATAYVHGHQVGGTNPSLVEAMAAGNAVIAHENPYNHWVAGDEELYFRDVSELDEHFTAIEGDPTLLHTMRAASRARHISCFRRELVLRAYEDLLLGNALQVPQWAL